MLPYECRNSPKPMSVRCTSALIVLIECRRCDWVTNTDGTSELFDIGKHECVRCKHTLKTSLFAP